MSGGCADPGGSIGAFLCQAGQMLRAAAIEAPRMEARILLSAAMDCMAEDLLRDPRATVQDEAAARFRVMLRRRLAHEPMAYITGHVGFWTLDLAVSPATLIPRADTETLIEAALDQFPDRRAVRRVLDLGTGTGALLLAALSEFPDAFGLGLDRLPEAAALAAANARANGLAARVAFVVADWAAPLAGRFDLILSNPPYIPTADITGLMPEVARHEPRSALDGGADGLDAYRVIIAALPGLLAPGGRAILELGQGQGRDVGAIANAQGLPLHMIGTRADLGGIERALILGS